MKGPLAGISSWQRYKFEAPVRMIALTLAV